MMNLRKTEKEESRLIDIKGLTEYLSIGRNSAMEIGKEANAVVRIGRRVLYDKRRIDKYIDELNKVS